MWHVTFRNYDRAYRISSTQEYLEVEPLKMKHELTQINDYSKWMFEKIDEECKLSCNLNITTNNNDITNTTHMLVLPEVIEDKES